MRSKNAARNDRVQTTEANQKPIEEILIFLNGLFVFGLYRIRWGIGKCSFIGCLVIFSSFSYTVKRQQQRKYIRHRLRPEQSCFVKDRAEDEHSRSVNKPLTGDIDD